MTLTEVLTQYPGCKKVRYGRVTTWTLTTCNPRGTVIRCGDCKSVGPIRPTKEEAWAAWDRRVK